MRIGERRERIGMFEWRERGREREQKAPSSPLQKTSQHPPFSLSLSLSLSLLGGYWPDQLWPTKASICRPKGENVLHLQNPLPFAYVAAREWRRHFFAIYPSQAITHPGGVHAAETLRSALHDCLPCTWRKGVTSIAKLLIKVRSGTN